MHYKCDALQHMSTTQLSIRINSTTRKTLADFADSLGMSLGAFLVQSGLQTARNGELVISPTLVPTTKLEKAIAQGIKEYESGKLIEYSHKDAIEHLRKMV
jgi:antitoxin component of RelBE/YafQ-DinJ toxin-antitoxin module